MNVKIDMSLDLMKQVKNMDFGSVMPKTVAISYGVPSSFANRDIYICLGSKDNVIMRKILFLSYHFLIQHFHYDLY